MWYLIISFTDLCRLSYYVMIHCLRASPTLLQQNLGRRFSASKMHLSPPVWRRLLSVQRQWFSCGGSVVGDMLFNVLPIVYGSYVSLFCYALLSVHSSFAIILKRKRKLQSS